MYNPTNITNDAKEIPMATDRYRIDCGKVPSESGCTLVIEGPEEDVLDAAVDHARSKHGHTEPPDVLREAIRKDLDPV
jgi:predicted small metal-binding protein